MSRIARGSPLLYLLVAFAAWGGDGVIEINHTCANGAGCFQGDGPGYPVEINGAAGGSYRLTSDLRLDHPSFFNADSTAILIQSDRISVDLGGFGIYGPCLSSCVGLGGSGDGVSAADFVEAVEVRNGSVTGMGRHGVSFGTSGIAHGLRVISNSGIGIRGNVASLAHDNTSERNGQAGISVGDSSTVRDNSARINGLNGIEAGSDSVVSGNASTGNSGSGIRTAGGAVVTGNTAHGNSENGIFAGAGSIVRGNSARANGTGAVGDGIRAEAGSSVKDNTVRFNKNLGLSLVFPAPYADNVISGNTGGTVSGGPDLGGNYCDTPTGSCP